MKKKVLTNLIICMLVCSSIFVVTGCGKDKEETPIVHPIKITISIDYPAKSGLDDVEEVDFKIEEDSTVLDAIQLYCNVNELPVTVETTDASIQGINGVDNGDYSAKRHWQYKINGELSETPENEKILKDGDTLAWVFNK